MSTSFIDLNADLRRDWWTARTASADLYHDFADSLLQAVGAEIAKMHLAEVIHGDLTTSNMMVRLLPTPVSPNDPLFEVVSCS